MCDHRHANPELDKSAKDWVANVTRYVRKQNEERTRMELCTPANFALGPDYESQEELYGQNLAQLRRLKAKYDPKKVFRRGWVLEPDFA